MSYDLNFDQYIEVGGVPLSTSAWEVLNMHVLLSGPATRGENLIMPGAYGVRPLRHRPTEKTVTLNVAIWGDLDPDGNLHADPQAGVWANWLALRNQFNTLLTTDGDSTALVRVHYRGGVLEGRAQVLTYELGDTYNPSTLSATLDLNLIGGMLT